MGLYTKLATAIAEDTRLPRDIKTSLVDGLYQPFASLTVGAVSGSIVAAAAALWSNDLAITLAATAVTIIGFSRVVLARTYLSERTKNVASYEKWETYFTIGAFAFAASLGVLSFLITTQSSNLALQVITPTFTIGYAAGISGRNAGRPLLAIGQVLLSAMPLSAGLFLSGDGERASLGVLSLLFTYGMMDITLSTRAIIISALVTTRDKKTLAEKFEAQAKLFDIALKNMSHGLCMFDEDGGLQVWNNQFIEILGIDPQIVRAGATAESIFRLSHVKLKLSNESTSADILDYIETTKILRSGNLVIELSDNRIVSLMQRETAEKGFVIIFEDITDRRRTEDRIRQMASYDDLTGLLNRISFKSKVSDAFKATGEKTNAFALHLLDLDRFKVINDTMGHPAGDRLLQLVATRLEGVSQISQTVARLGGDEFVMIQHAVRCNDDAVELAERILQELNRPFEIEGISVSVRASIGIALAPEHAEDEDKLLKRADIALYAAKSDGRGNFKIFVQDMELQTQARQKIEADLKVALTNGELKLHYQPIVNLQTGKITCCEALVRWQHPVAGIISPSDFIPVAEDTGLILQLGEWVLEEACREACNWPQDVSVAVNLSPRQFGALELATQVVKALERTGLPATRLELEITESVTLGETHRVIAIINDLRQLGVSLSLDDFGTGYSSLSYLRKYPFDKLKIDRSFVVDLVDNSDSLAIIEAIISMGRSIGMAIVVEGVETLSQLTLLREQDCDFAQGYYFSKPVSAENIRVLLLH